MIYASLCDGIGAVHVAWNPLGWRCAWTSEIEAFPAAVVEHHHGLKNLGDMTLITEQMIDGVSGWAIDLLVGGTPCQSFSVAGLRRGLDDPRGNLALRFIQLVGTLRPTWVVWENVPGVLSSGGGRDFGTLLGALGELGYGFAYRVLDAQWFGVAQRRRRVFVVGHARDWRRAAAVLFERESLRGDPPTRGASRKDVAGATVARAARDGGAANAAVDAGHLIFVGNNTAGPIDVAPACLSHKSPNGRQDFASEAFVVSDDPAHAICANEQKTYTNEGKVFKLRNVVGHAQPFVKAKRAQSATDDESWVAGSVAPTQNTFDQGDTRATTVVAQGFTFSGYSNQPARITGDALAFKPGQSEAAGGTFVTRDFAPTIQSQNNGSTAVPAVVAFRDPIPTPTAKMQGSSGWAPVNEDAHLVGVCMQPTAVRRLTPRECERLQGFPDDYTAIMFRGKPAADGPRYRAIGNSMAVPVMQWIGERIARLEALGLESAR